MHARPPEITEIRGVDRAATAPASASPSRGPPATTAMCTPESLPRKASGTDSWRMVFLNTAETTSAAPATASRTRAIGSHFTRPKAVMAMPQPMTAMTTARPWLRIRGTHPLNKAPRRAPAPGAP